MLEDHAHDRVPFADDDRSPATLGLLVISAAVGRAWPLALPAISWPLYFLGLHAGWWGHGVGDMWPYALIGVTLLGIAAVAAGLGLRALLLPARLPGRPADPHRS